MCSDPRTLSSYPTPVMWTVSEEEVFGDWWPIPFLCSFIGVFRDFWGGDRVSFLTARADAGQLLELPIWFLCRQVVGLQDRAAFSVLRISFPAYKLFIFLSENLNALPEHFVWEWEGWLIFPSLLGFLCLPLVVIDGDGGRVYHGRWYLGEFLLLVNQFLRGALQEAK